MDSRLRELERRARATADPVDMAALGQARVRVGLSLVDQARAALEDLASAPPEWRPLRGGKAPAWNPRSKRVSPTDVPGRGSSARVGDVVWCHKAKAAALVVRTVGDLPCVSGYGYRSQSARLCVTAGGVVHTVTSYPRAAFRDGARLRLSVPPEWRKLAGEWRLKHLVKARSDEGHQNGLEAAAAAALDDPAPPLAFVDAEGDACGACYGTGADDGFGPEECDRCEGTGEPL